MEYEKNLLQHKKMKAELQESEVKVKAEIQRRESDIQATMDILDAYMNLCMIEAELNEDGDSKALVISDRCFPVLSFSINCFVIRFFKVV